MDTPPLWLIIMSSSVFAFITRYRAYQQGRNHKLWFWLGFIFGLWGFLALYITKKSTKKASNPVQSAPLKPLYSLPLGAWYYAFGQEILGPLSQTHLLELIDKSDVNSETLVWHESQTDWQKLEFFKA
jgi:hypothetical protein